MANTFKLKTNAAMPATAGSPLKLYAVPSGTTTVVLGLMLCNVHTSQVTADVKLVSNTSDSETNEEVFLVRDIPIPAGSSVELLAGNKIVLQYANGTGDQINIDCDVSGKIDATLSIMEIT